MTRVSNHLQRLVVSLGSLSRENRYQLLERDILPSLAALEAALQTERAAKIPEGVVAAMERIARVIATDTVNCEAHAEQLSTYARRYMILVKAQELGTASAAK